MKNMSISLAAAVSAILVASASVTPAAAYVVRKSVTTTHGYFGHGCRTVRTVSIVPGGKKVFLHKVCR